MMIRSTLLLMATSLAMGSIHSSEQDKSDRDCHLREMGRHGRTGDCQPLSPAEKQNMLDAIKRAIPKMIAAITQQQIDDNPEAFPIDAKGKSFEEVQKEMLANANNVIGKVDVNQSSPESDAFLKMLYAEATQMDGKQHRAAEAQLRDQIRSEITKYYKDESIEQLRKYAREVEPKLASLDDEQLRAAMLKRALQITDEAYRRELAGDKTSPTLEELLKEGEQHNPPADGARTQAFVRKTQASTLGTSDNLLKYAKEAIENAFRRIGHASYARMKAYAADIQDDKENKVDPNLPEAELRAALLRRADRMVEDAYRRGDEQELKALAHDG